MAEVLLKKKKRTYELLDIDQQIELMEQTESYFETLHFGMSEFQIRRFLLNPIDFPTPFSRWRQAKLELWTRFCNIMEDHFQFRELHAKIELNRARIDNYISKGDDISKAKAKLCEIRISRYAFQLSTMKKMVTEKLREMQTFYDAIREEEPNVSKDEQKEDEEFWNEKMKQDPVTFKQRYSTTPRRDEDERTAG